MDSQRWTRVRELLEEALDRPGAGREAFVRERAESDEVAAEVLSLLDSDAAGSASLEPPTSGELFLTDGLGPGSTLGAYELVDLLGEGGMGRVWRARRADEHFEKEVAIKVLRAGLGGAEVIERFRQERQVLADLEHPGIARLVDGGVTQDGRPFLVMELVDGEPLHRWCRSRSLDTAARVALFAEVCDAVQYAHQRLVVHRDLKPSNVIVSRDGHPKLLDFGIAKVLGGPQDDVTEVDERALTPGYASPEQVRGEVVTAASDVYSLGVLLFELLTGERPYQVTSASRYAIERAICESEPPLPSEVAPAQDRHALVGDLDTIVLECLRKEPSRRYASVATLASDLRAHLDGYPVSARPDTWTYRTGKFVHRNLAAVAIGVLAFFSLISGVLVSGRMYVRASEANVQLEDTNDKLELANSEQRQARDLAEERREELTGVLDRILLRMEEAGGGNDALFDELVGYYRSEAEFARDNETRKREVVRGCIEVARRLGGYMGGNVGRADRARAILDVAGPILSDLVGRQQPDDDLTSLEVDFDLLSADMVALAGDVGDALSLAQRALERIDGPREDLSTLLLRKRVLVHGRLGDLYRDQVRIPAARAAREASVDDARELVARGDEPGDGLKLVESLCLLGELCFYFEDEVDRTFALYEEARAEADVMVAAMPDLPDVYVRRAQIDRDLAAYLVRLERPEDALDHALAAIDEYEHVRVLEPGNANSAVMLAFAHNSAAQALNRLRRNEEGLDHALTSVALQEGVLILDPDNRYYRRNLASSRGTAAMMLGSLDRYAEALEYCERNLEDILELAAEDTAKVEHQVSNAVCHYMVAQTAWNWARDEDMPFEHRRAAARRAHEVMRAGALLARELDEQGHLTGRDAEMAQRFAGWSEEIGVLVGELEAEAVTRGDG